MSPDVIVIGGGFAGLSAATELARRGRRVWLFEARPSLGGRAVAYRDEETGDLVDNGQHVVLGCYHATFQFLGTIGALDRVWLQPGLDICMVDRAGRASRLRSRPLPAPWHLFAGLMEWEALGLADKLAATKLRRPLGLAVRQLAGQPVVAASPGETVENWLIRNGQTPRVREMLWEPLARAALNEDPRRAAAPPFVRVLAEMFGGSQRDAAIGLFTRPLHLAYAEPARAYIEARGGTVMTGTPARIVIECGEVAEVEAREGRWQAPAIIAAVPWFAFSNLFADRPPVLRDLMERAARMVALPIVTVNVWLDRTVLDSPFLGLPGRSYQWVFDKRVAFRGEASHVSLVSSAATELVAWSNEALIAEAVGELTAAVPAFAEARVRRASVIRERRATFSLAPDQPARPAATTPIPNLFLAGDWTDTGLPATIESAVISGRRAAEAALRNAEGGARNAEGGTRNPKFSRSR